MNKQNQYDEITQSFAGEGSFAAVYTGASTHIGTRDYQEDSYYVTEMSKSQDGSLIKAYGIVCDGMGGLDNGDKASKLTTELIKEVFDNVTTDEGLETYLINEVGKIDLRVREECGFGDSMTTGTTLVAALIFRNYLHWIGIGDSRIYVLRGDEIVQVTQDHTFMMTLKKQVEDGLITQEEADTHPQRGALISHIGSGTIRHINSNKAGLRLLHGDIALLCSDGLVKSLDDDEIVSIIQGSYGNMKEAADRLTLMAFDSSDGGKDNTTVVLMQYLE